MGGTQFISHLRGGSLLANGRIKIITDDGWYFVKQVGSHKQYKHPTKQGKVTVPNHTGDIHPKTVKSILKQAGL